MKKNKNRLFSALFDKYMERAELKNTELVGITGVEPETVSRWIQGYQIPIRDNLLKCIEPFGFPAQEDGLRECNEFFAEAGYSLTQEEKRKYFPRKTKYDWGTQRQAKFFVGRTETLEKLKKWVIEDKCGLVSIVGFGGVGKTSLSIELAGIGKTALSGQLAQDIGDNFDYVIWRSLSNAPPIEEILSDMIKFISEQQDVESSRHTIKKLLNYLKKYRCLLILDNVEDIFQSGKPANQYREKHKEYARLFEQLGEVPHQSCLLLNSRIVPPEIKDLNNHYAEVQLLRLEGLNEQEGQKLFNQINDHFAHSPEFDTQWKNIMENSKGNPFVLERFAASIKGTGNVSKFFHELSAESIKYTGNVSKFFNKLSLEAFLQKIFDNLSDTEQELVYWLSINREFVSQDELKNDLLFFNSKEQLNNTRCSSFL